MPSKPETLHSYQDESSSDVETWPLRSQYVENKRKLGIKEFVEYMINDIDSESLYFNY